MKVVTVAMVFWLKSQKISYATEVPGRISKWRPLYMKLLLQPSKFHCIWGWNFAQFVSDRFRASILLLGDHRINGVMGCLKEASGGSQLSWQFAGFCLKSHAYMNLAFFFCRFFLLLSWRKLKFKTQLSFFHSPNLRDSSGMPSGYDLKREEWKLQEPNLLP